MRTHQPAPAGPLALPTSLALLALLAGSAEVADDVEDDVEDDVAEEVADDFDFGSA